MNRRERRIMAAAAVLVMLAALPSWLSAQAAPPAGARFKCNDGTYSNAATPRGACSRHGGVASAVAAPAPAPAPTPAPAPSARAAARTAAAPAGATFKCVDGTYSTAATARGACSRHGGVAQALTAAAAAAPAAPAPAAPVPAPNPRAAAPAQAPAPAGAPANATALCKDGTYSTSQHRSGTCARHGGVDRWIQRPAN